jgi:hypothetical protein
MKACGAEFVKKSLELARSMTVLADEGDQSGVDDGCAVLCGIMRDCAYKIRARAEEERELHKVMGVWQS